jgi:hypothetical protein
MGNVILTEKQLEKLINKMKTISENHEQGSYMAKQQLFTIATLAHAMWEKMEEGEQLEDWMESKISQAEQSIVGVVKTFMYDEFKGESQPNDGMGKLNYDEIIIGK